MARTVSFPRRELRSLERAWLARNRWLVAAAGGFVGLLLGGSTWWVASFTNGGQVAGYVLGAMHVGVVVAFGGLLYLAFLAHVPQAMHQLRGAWGEDATADELRKAQRAELIWDWVDSLALERGDLDHFVVTRRGGLVVLDSKFRTTDDPGAIARLAADAVRVRTRAEGVARTELDSQRGARHRDRRVNPVSVRPAVVVWGKLQHELTGVSSHDGVDVVPGRLLRSWLAGLDGSPVDSDAAHELIAKLRARRAVGAARA